MVSSCIINSWFTWWGFEISIAIFCPCHRKLVGWLCQCPIRSILEWRFYFYGFVYWAPNNICFYISWRCSFFGFVMLKLGQHWLHQKEISFHIVLIPSLTSLLIGCFLICDTILFLRFILQVIVLGSYYMASVVAKKAFLQWFGSLL